MQSFFYILSITLVIASIVVLVVFPLPLGIDFRGGSLMELQFLPDEEAAVHVPDKQAIMEAFGVLGLGEVRIQRAGDDTMILRFRDVDEETHQAILSALANLTPSEITEKRFDSIGPVIGGETMNRSAWAIVFVLIAVVAYVAWAFRKVSYPVRSWKYGITALLVLFHDVVITLGIAAIYMRFSGDEIGTPFVVAILVILGYSVNDTIVVFDRLRENLLLFGRQISFDEAVRRSVKESFARSLNTSLTTLFVLSAVYVFGGATIQSFVAVLIFGIAIGTYSSLAVAAPLLAVWARRT
jgi:preprotein translocase subunit SecF